MTDGSIGDMIYFHSYKNPGLVLDIVEGSLSFITIFTKFYGEATIIFLSWCP